MLDYRRGVKMTSWLVPWRWAEVKMLGLTENLGMVEDICWHEQAPLADAFAWWICSLISSFKIQLVVNVQLAFFGDWHRLADW